MDELVESLLNVKKKKDGSDYQKGKVRQNINELKRTITKLNFEKEPAIVLALATAEKIRLDMDNPVEANIPEKKKPTKPKPAENVAGVRRSSRLNKGKKGKGRYSPDEEEEADLDAFLDDYEEDVTYEEVAPGDDTFDEELEAFLASDDESPPAAAPKKKSVTYANEPSLDSRIDSFLSEVAQDSETFARDRAHVIHFATGSGSLKSQLMKGRDRYLERLSAFLEGDKTVKVRMMDNSEVLVSSLRPNRSSLRSMLKEKAGAPRYCKCD